MKTLNEVFCSLSTRRRYEVWFVRLGLADGSGAWWFRYLLMNPGKGGCEGDPNGMPVQVWATWFPRDGKPHSFIQGFPLQGLDLSARGTSPFHFRIANNAIEENFCRGALHVEGHAISWNLRYRSTFCVTLSDKGWIGFSRTPHSDALFTGQITCDGRNCEGNPLGFGVQGHNCGYRHRDCWIWAHSYFSRPNRSPSTLEALIYDMPFGLTFRKAVLWHEGKQHIFRNLKETTKDRGKLQWDFQCSERDGLELEVVIDGSGPNIHRLQYLKTNCKGSFEVANNSNARAVLCVKPGSGLVEKLETASDAVLEMGGRSSG